MGLPWLWRAGAPLAVAHGFPTVVASVVAEHRLQGVWAPQSRLTGPGAWAQQLWRVGIVAPWHVGSSQTISQTHLLHWQVDSYPPFHPWLGNYDPTHLAAKKPKHESEAILKQT